VRGGDKKVRERRKEWDVRRRDGEATWEEINGGWKRGGN
jgi:hypothetical protein